MAYIGKAPNTAIVNQATSQSFSGNGSTTFTLNRSVNVGEDLEVFVNNVQQEPGSGKSYTASGTTLTFDEAPPSGTNNVYVIYRGEATINPRLEHDANAALAATTGTFSGAVSATTGTFTQLNSDNIRIDGNTISSTDTNGDITLDPDGSGSVAITNSGSSNALEIATHISTYEVQFTGSTHANLTANVGANPFYIQNLGAGTMNFQTSATDRLVIDASGRVTMPSQPSCNVRQSSGLSIGTGDLYTQCNFDTNQHNIGNHFNFSNDRFTAPVAGRYLVLYRSGVYFTTGRIGLALRKNGSNVSPDPYETASGNNFQYPRVSNAMIVDLAVNDYLTVHVNQYTGGNQTYFGSHLMIQLLG